MADAAMRIKGRAVRRCGELLKQVEPQRGGDRGGGRPGTNGKPMGKQPPNGSRQSVAEAAGLSPDQTKQALQVASIPKRDFEAAIEAEKPPTLRELWDAARLEPLSVDWAEAMRRARERTDADGK